MTNQLYPLQFLCVFLIASTPFLLSAQCISGNCTNGTGTFVYPSGAKYTGDFVNSRSHGQGICYYTNNTTYQGSWKNGYPEGAGKKTFANGKEWVGQWRKGQAYDQNGTKVLLSKAAPPKEKYDIKEYKAPDLLSAKAAGEGCIEGNCYNGQGTYIYRGQSARYIGTFKNEMPHGYGTIVYASGDQYEGNWANGNFNGQGTLYLGNGNQITGMWANGRHVKNGTNRPNSTPTQPSNVWAVIVGVSSYNHMPTLKFTDDDAYRMYAFLKSPEGGALADDHLQVLIDEDATRNKILGALENVFLKAGRNDLVLLYFSGHGLQGSFLPSDFDGFNNKILHEEINSIFQRSQAKYKLCIADACHSGSLLAMKGATTKAENVVSKYYARLAQSAPGTALILSSKSNETSLESSGLRQGVFSHFLIRGLKGEADSNYDKIVTIQELFDYTDYNVRTYTGSRQSPVIKGNYDRNMPAAVVR